MEKYFNSISIIVGIVGGFLCKHLGGFDMKVAIIGAGNGGITACADLKDRGFEVSLFESDRFSKNLDFIKEQGGVYFCEGDIVGYNKDVEGKFVKIDLI